MIGLQDADSRTKGLQGKASVRLKITTASGRADVFCAKLKATRSNAHPLTFQ